MLTFALAVLLVRGGERVTLLGGGLRPDSSERALERLAARLCPDSNSLPAAQAVPRHARLVLISDFLSPICEIAARVKSFAAQGARGHLLQVLDPAEETLPFSGRVIFTGYEGEDALPVARTETLRAAYQARLDSHRAELTTIARAAGWSFAHHRTDQPPENALITLMEGLSQP